MGHFTKVGQGCDPVGRGRSCDVLPSAVLVHLSSVTFCRGGFLRVLATVVVFICNTRVRASFGRADASMFELPQVVSSYLCAIS
jgi:hypothetical protein